MKHFMEKWLSGKILKRGRFWKLKKKKEQQGKTRDPLCCSPFATLHLPHLLKCLHNNRLPYTEACVTHLSMLNTACLTPSSTPSTPSKRLQLPKPIPEYPIQWFPEISHPMV
jgi:hypothetical protein